MFDIFRVQRVDHSEDCYEPYAPVSELAETHFSAVWSLGTPHGRAQHIWAKVWSVSLRKLWLFDGKGNILHEADIQIRSGNS